MIAPSAPRIRPVVPVLLALLLTVLAVLVPARPAAAHDSLLSSDPADGSTVETLPEQVRLSFSAALLPDGGGTVVEVTDAEGASLTDGAPEVDQNVVTQLLSPDAATGTVTVRWRVVSSDGHPISGEFAFTVTGNGEPDPTATPTEAPAATTAPTAEPTATPLVTTSVDDDAESPLPWIIGGGIVLVALVVVIALLAARARQGRAPADGGSASRDGRDGR